MARCRFGNLAAFQWKCAAAPARRRFGIGAVFFADLLVSMHKQWVSKRKIKSAGGLPKNLCADSVLFGQLPLAFFLSIGLSSICRHGSTQPRRRRRWHARRRALHRKRPPRAGSAHTPRCSCVRVSGSGSIHMEGRRAPAQRRARQQRRSKKKMRSEVGRWPGLVIGPTQTAPRTEGVASSELPVP